MTIRDIVFTGLEKGLGKKRIIKKICLLANEKEAEKLYKEYKNEYYILK